jgi:hypothetical protein
MTPATARSSALGRLAAMFLIALIVSPVTAPFSAASGTLEASPSGPADSVKSETAQHDAVVELVAVHDDLSWSVVPYRSPAPRPTVKSARINRILRL